MMTEEEFWTQQVIEGRRDQLANVRKSATAWSGLFGAVLAVFGTVAFAGGLTALEDLPSQHASLVRVMTMAAAVLALGATVSSGYPISPTNDNTWQGRRNTTNARAETARVELLIAKSLGFLAAVLVLVGSSLVLFTDKDTPAPKPPTVVAVVDGSAVCGTLSITSDGATVGGTPLSGAVTSFTVVTACS
jgi:hypothetical protein